MAKKVKDSQRLSLSQAKATGQLDVFIRQEEARGISGDMDKLDDALRAVSKAPPTAHRKGRLKARGNSGGK